MCQLKDYNIGSLSTAASFVSIIIDILIPILPIFTVKIKLLVLADDDLDFFRIQSNERGIINTLWDAPRHMQLDQRPACRTRVDYPKLNIIVNGYPVSIIESLQSK